MTLFLKAWGWGGGPLGVAFKIHLAKKNSNLLLMREHKHSTHAINDE